MKVLLDTHVWLWRALDDSYLTARAREVLDAPEHELHLSAISPWEAMVLARKGRLDLGANPERWVRAALRGAPLVVLPLSLDVAIRGETLPDLDEHRDPADRWILATADLHGCTLLTADQRLRAYSHVATLW